ncbi:MAG: hypothetical protein NC131_08605 [Roseburia sp.]|nr:hypothetical protein [Roseburia sp.]
MTTHREQTKKQLRRILSIAFSLDAAMDEFMAGMTEEDGDGNFDLKDGHDEEAFIAMGNFQEQVQNMTYDLLRIILNKYECKDEDDDD